MQYEHAFRVERSHEIYEVKKPTSPPPTNSSFNKMI